MVFGAGLCRTFLVPSNQVFLHAFDIIQVQQSFHLIVLDDLLGCLAQSLQVGQAALALLVFVQGFQSSLSFRQTGLQSCLGRSDMPQRADNQHSFDPGDLLSSTVAVKVWGNS